MLYGWIVRGTGCVTWFAFTLGLSVIGEERGEPGVYLAAGMTGYGVGLGHRDGDLARGRTAFAAGAAGRDRVGLHGAVLDCHGSVDYAGGCCRDGRAVGADRRTGDRCDLGADHAVVGGR